MTTPDPTPAPLDLPHGRLTASAALRLLTQAGPTARGPRTIPSGRMSATEALALLGGAVPDTSATGTTRTTRTSDPSSTSGAAATSSAPTRGATGVEEAATAAAAGGAGDAATSTGDTRASDRQAGDEPPASSETTDTPAPRPAATTETGGTGGTGVPAGTVPATPGKLPSPAPLLAHDPRAWDRVHDAATAGSITASEALRILRGE